MRACSFLLALAALLLGACSSNLKMAELTPFTATAKTRVVWEEHAGKSGDHVFAPAIAASSVFAAASDGTLIRVDDGKLIWKINVGQPLSGGVGTDGKLVAVASPKGDLLVFHTADGTLAWKARATSEILAPPAVGEGLIIVRSGDNSLIAFDASDGRRKWLYQRPAPALVLRTMAPPVISGKYAFSGFPGGKLVAVNMENNGVSVWEGTVALPRGATELERVADITSLPIIAGRTICAIAFQGRVACFDLNSGNLLWAREMSSSSGLAADAQNLFITDEKGAVHALDLATGSSLWKQDALSLRRVSAPLPFRGKVAVADAQGVVHFLNREDGAFAARAFTDGSPVLTAPRALGSTLVVQTSKGGLYAIEVE
jgi:outer membrane protein assembly factor BamB